jgi:hypothetical protein
LRLRKERSGSTDRSEQEGPRAALFESDVEVRGATAVDAQAIGDVFDAAVR